MMKTTHSLIALTLLVVLTASQAARGDEAGSPRDLLQKAIDTAPQVTFHAKVKLSSHGLIRDLELGHRRLDASTLASYLEVTAPHDVKDTRFLFIERKQGRDEQFIYVPAMKRTIQVGEQTRSQPFLGSDFYVSDLVTPDPEAFTMTWVGEEKIKDRSCKLVEAKPNPGTNWLYSKAIYAVDPTDLLVLRLELYDGKGKLLKVWTLDKFEKVDGFWTPYLQRMKNVQEDSESTIEMIEVKYNAELPDEMFNRSYLER